MPDSPLVWQHSSQLCQWHPWAVPPGGDDPDHSLWFITYKTAFKFTFHCHFSLLSHCPGRSCGTNKVIRVKGIRKRAEPFASGLQGTFSLLQQGVLPTRSQCFYSNIAFYTCLFYFNHSAYIALHKTSSFLCNL